MRHRTDREKETFIYGIILLVVGIIFLLNTVGFPILHHLWRFWPSVLIVMGLSKLRRSKGHKHGRAA